MSRRYASYQPPDDLTDETLYLAMFGTQTRQAHRPMPGCQERCCAAGWPVAVRVAQARLDWLVGGMDLVPPAALVVLGVSVLIVIGRAVW